MRRQRKEERMSKNRGSQYKIKLNFFNESLINFGLDLIYQLYLRLIYLMTIVI